MSSISRVTVAFSLISVGMLASALAQDAPPRTQSGKTTGTTAGVKKPKVVQVGNTETASEGEATPKPRNVNKVVNPNPAQGGRERPSAAPLRITKAADEPVDPALEQLLLEWETQSAKIQTLQCTFTKYRYNHKFNVEYRADGDVKFQAPDRGVYLQTPATITSSMKGRSKDAKGNEIKKPYALKPDDAQHWVCTGQQVYMIDKAKKTFDVAPIPKDIQGQNIVNSPLPFLFGMKAKDAKRRFSLKLLSQNPDRHEIMIRAIPKTREDAQNYQQAIILLDDTNFTPKAVKLVDPTGNEEIVHSFQKMQVNRQLAARVFEPNLGGLKPLLKDTAKGPVQQPAIPSRTVNQPANSRKG